jgi:GTP cyclohydrolase III
MGSAGMTEKNFFIAIDANEIGKKIEKYILNEQHEELEKFSNEMVKSVADTKNYILNHGGKVFMAGGDNVLAEIPADIVTVILDYVRTLNMNAGYNFSVGVGIGSSGAYVALKYAKVNGLFAAKYEKDSFQEIE